MRRCSVMFIDDEELIRESFLMLTDWQGGRFELVGVFKNGEAAWDYLRENPADIVVSDINMPFMDGIQLLEKIRQEKLETKLIFLTGFEFFEYAQKAVQLQAFDFILKPITREKLLTALERAADDIARAEAVSEAATAGAELARSHYLNDVLYGRANATEEEAERFGLYGGRGSYLLITAAVDVKQGGDPDSAEAWKCYFREEAMARKEEMERERNLRFKLCFTEAPGWNIRLIFLSTEKELFSSAFVEDFIQRLLPLQANSAGNRVTFVAGRCRDTLSELQESYRKVKHAAGRRHVLSGSGWKLIYANDYPVEYAEAPSEIVLPSDTFLQHIRTGFVEEVQCDIRQIYAPFHSGRYISLESARMITTELMIIAAKGTVSESDQSVSSLARLNHIQQLTTLEELETEITQYAVSIAAERRESGKQKKGLTNGALDYLRQNFAREDLSLNDVAEAMNISVPYMAVLFKQETGQSFGNHLLTIRMEKAQELLKTSSLSIAEIAERVGYSTAQYFAVRFKKYTGLTPGAYREQ